MPQEAPKKRYQELKEDAAQGGYRLNDDSAFCVSLAAGLLKNKERYGIEACPCRLVQGKPEDNIDIVCPCVYRDDDLDEYGACYCALYVTDNYDEGKQIPDRRMWEKAKAQEPAFKRAENQLAYPVWRCTVCGYLCANHHPPQKCPICKAKKERFEQFA